VSAGFHRAGGMERANLELARYLVGQGTEIHLVAHHVDQALPANRLVQVHSIPRPISSFMLGEPFLSRKGVAIAARLTLERPGTRVLVNGGCCGWPDINWVHYVHAAWRTHEDGAPLWFKAKNRAMKLSARRQEQYALRRARFIVANSNKTKCDLTNLLGLPDANIRTVYLGVDPESKHFGLKERSIGRALLGKPFERPIVAFVGAIGHDNRKGFDILYAAWKMLCAMPSWDADLVVAGGGRAIPRWQKRIVDAGLAHRVTLLGFTDRVNDLLAAADLLVSPVRYEAFGLNVQEALAGGVPAIVSATAGVAELYPSYLKDLLLLNPEDVDDLVAKLISWRASMSYWKERIVPLSRELRAYTWEEMARRIVEFASESAASGAHVNENTTTRRRRPCDRMRGSNGR
jgi:glycosyltransferase involved in cell wall biosynthesis